MRPRRAASTQVIPALMINPMPGIRTTVPKHEHGDLHFGAGVAQQQEADAEQDQHDADLEGRENAGHGIGYALARLEVHGNGRGFKEALACFGFHVGGELLVGTELVDEAPVDFALQLEDAAPAAVFKKDADHAT